MEIEDFSHREKTIIRYLREEFTKFVLGKSPGTIRVIVHAGEPKPRIAQVRKFLRREYIPTTGSFDAKKKAWLLTPRPSNITSRIEQGALGTDFRILKRRQK